MRHQNDAQIIALSTSATNFLKQKTIFLQHYMSIKLEAQD